MGRVRQPSAYGFYPPAKIDLEKSLRACFLDTHGTGQVPTVNAERQNRVIAGVTPHAGYVYSGPIASHLYGLLAEDGFPETFVLIGPRHGYMRFEGAAIMAAGAWSTPLGECPIDSELAKTILENSNVSGSPCIIESEEAHLQEHSLEVQLPFLQFLSKQQPLQIVPLVISSLKYSTCERVGESIATGIRKSGRDVTLLASTDFTHYGAHFYGYAPVGSGPLDKVLKWVYETDGNLVHKIEQLDGESLMKTVVKEGLTMCGASAVATMLVTSRLLGATKGELLKYATSYDVRGGTDAIVGYAALAIRR